MQIFERCCSLSNVFEKKFSQRKHSNQLRLSTDNSNYNHQLQNLYGKTNIKKPAKLNKNRKTPRKESTIIQQIAQTVSNMMPDLHKPLGNDANNSNNNSQPYDRYFLSDTSSSEQSDQKQEKVDTSNDKNRNRSQSSNFDDKQFVTKLYSTDFSKACQSGIYELYYEKQQGEEPYRKKQNSSKLYKDFTEFKQSARLTINPKPFESCEKIPEVNNANENESDCEIASIDDEPDIQEMDTRYTSAERFSSNLMKRVSDSLGRSGDLVNKLNSILQRKRDSSSVFMMVCSQSDEKLK